uniref:Synaptotagmin 11 n=1 Tax=Taeniopygia guttata TaxID=59729 RepID=H1A475_TAEGU
MAEITSVHPGFDVSPVVAGLIGATVLVVSVSVTVFVWTCCHQQAEKKHKTPPYKFIHMLKGISIYPETLSNKKKINRIRRDKEGGRGNLLVDAAESGLMGPTKAPDGPPQVDQLPIKVDYGDELSPDQSLTPGGSKTSSPSSPGDDVLLGDLTFSVDYNFPKKALVVTIQEAHGLPVMDEHTQSSDPYIKMTILPDKRHRVKTRVLRKTLEPVFDETFTFYGIPYSQLQDLVLHFLVLSFDRFSRDDVIGEVMVPLAGVDPSTGKVQLTREILKRNIQKCISRGELQVSLSYQPVAQRMTVVVLKARHLPKMDITGLSGERLLRPQAHRQEENPRQEVHFEPRLQRVLHLRHPRGSAARHQHRVPGDRLRPHHQERGGGQADPGRAQRQRRGHRALAPGLRQPRQSRGQVAQPERVLSPPRTDGKLGFSCRTEGLGVEEQQLVGSYGCSQFRQGERRVSKQVLAFPACKRIVPRRISAVRVEEL